MFRIVRPFRVNAVCPHSHVTDKHGIVNFIATDRATRAPHTERPVLIENKSTRQQVNRSPKPSLQSAQCQLNTARAEEAQDGNTTLEYSVDRIVKHVSTSDNTGYVVQLHEYTAKDDTVKPPEHIPHLFIHAVGHEMRPMQNVTRVDPIANDVLH